MKLDKIEEDNLEYIEKQLSEISYEEIPKQFINQINKWFETISYLKSLIELKKDESTS